jgi:ABC-type transport system substrate-binding protein
MMKHRSAHILILLAVILSACVAQAAETPVIPAAPTETPQPLFTPTPVSRSLTVCLGDEPTTLYLYGGLNSAARSVLSAIYDGPIDLAKYVYDPVIIEKIPDLDWISSLDFEAECRGSGFWSLKDPELRQISSHPGRFCCSRRALA